jgi:hypothetical protein
MLESELALPEEERVDFVSVVTPNHLHFPVAHAFVDSKGRETATAAELEISGVFTTSFLIKTRDPQFCLSLTSPLLLPTEPPVAFRPACTPCEGRTYR